MAESGERGGAALQFEAVTIHRGGKLILKNLALTIPRGSLVVVLGPNGAGKSTLLQAALGELSPSQGEVHTLGHRLSLLPAREASKVRHRLGYMPQGGNQLPAFPLTTQEVVKIGLTASGEITKKSKTEQAQVLQHWLRRFGLTALADRSYQTLSGGEQRKAQLARVFTQEPELILLDEPTGHLDLTSQDDLMRLICEIWSETNRTLLLVTHELRQIPTETTHVCLLREGQLLAFGAPEQCLTSATLSRLFGAPMELVRHRGHYLALSGPKPKEPSLHGST